jgi:hypothetical protein
MAMASGVYGPFLRDSINNTKAFALNASDSVRYMFVSDTRTPDFNAHDEKADVTNEVTGTGYTTGGELLASPTWTIGSGFATFDANDVSLSTTTLTGVRGVELFDDTVTGKPLLAAVTFGADYNTTAGTFAITWSGSGIFRIDYIP